MNVKKFQLRKQESDRSSNQAVKKSIGSLNDGQNYAILTKEQLMAVCIDKDAVIESCVKSLREQFPKMIGKREIMDIYHCESDKALRILKLMFQMGYGNKIGKEILCVSEIPGRICEKHGR